MLPCLSDLMMKRKIIAAKKRIAITRKSDSRKIINSNIKATANAALQLARIRNLFGNDPKDYKMALRALIEHSTGAENSIYWDAFQKAVNPEQKLKRSDSNLLFKYFREEKNPEQKLRLGFELVDCLEEKAINGEKKSQVLIETIFDSIKPIAVKEKKQVEWLQRRALYFERIGDNATAYANYQIAANFANKFGDKEKEKELYKIMDKLKEIDEGI